MFTVTEKPFALGSLFFQTLLAYFGPLVSLTIVSWALNPPESSLWQAAAYLLTCLTGVALALGVSFVTSGSVRAGRWVWLIPVAILVVALIWDALVVPSELPSFFFDPLRAEGAEVGLLLYFLTLPTWGCCWYAATMHWVARRRERRLRSS